MGIAELERTASICNPEELRVWFETNQEILEIAALRTCQRVVLLGLLVVPTAPSRLERRAGEAGPWNVYSDDAAVRRLFHLSAGLDSRARGEREVREQVRKTASSVLSRSPRPVLRRLIRGAARASDHLGSQGVSSVADLAVRWLGERLRPGQRVLVIGAGTVGRRVAEGLAATQSVVLVYRTRPPDAGWLRQNAIELCPSSGLDSVLPQAAAVVAAAKTKGRLLEARALPPQPTGESRYFVDLGLPRNLDPEIGTLPRSVLVDLGGLPPEPVPVDQLVEMRRELDELAEVEIAALAGAAIEPALAEIWRRAEGARGDEWRRALRYAGAVSPQALIAFERMSERLVRRLLSGPALDLRKLAGRRGLPATDGGLPLVRETPPGRD